MYPFEEPKEQKNFLKSLARDSGILGALAGMLAPIPGVYVYYLIAFSYRMSFTHFYDFIKTPELFAKVLSLAVLMNLPFFFLFIKFNKDRNAMAVLGATILYGGIIAYLKFFA